MLRLLSPNDEYLIIKSPAINAFSCFERSPLSAIPVACVSSALVMPVLLLPIECQPPGDVNFSVNTHLEAVTEIYMNIAERADRAD